MRWLKKRLRNWINDDEDIYVPITLRSRDEFDSECIRFKVFRANGGTVIQTEQYDNKHDRQYNNLHVIVDGQDLGKELGKIITYESLKL
jgi:hypothetical protein